MPIPFLTDYLSPSKLATKQNEQHVYETIKIQYDQLGNLRQVNESFLIKHADTLSYNGPLPGL